MNNFFVYRQFLLYLEHLEFITDIFHTAQAEKYEEHTKKIIKKASRTCFSQQTCHICAVKSCFCRPAGNLLLMYVNSEIFTHRVSDSSIY